MLSIFHIENELDNTQQLNAIELRIFRTAAEKTKFMEDQFEVEVVIKEIFPSHIVCIYCKLIFAPLRKLQLLM